MQLVRLWQQVEEINKKHFPDNTLVPIVGNGKTTKPKFMFVFINPTKKNISADRNWQGPRFPFIGTKQVWRIFHRAGLFDDALMAHIEKKAWTPAFTDTVLEFLKAQEFYFTNIVKWTGHDATLPDAKKIELFLPLLKEEIKLVQPQYIVTFGLIPFERLTDTKIKLGEYYTTAVAQQKLTPYPLAVNGVQTQVIPCYFPIGRGDPKKAVVLLQLLQKF